MGILIVTMPSDADAQVVKLAIDKLGAECTIFYSGDLAGGAQWGFDPAGDVLSTEYRGISESHSFDRYDSVWMRRPCGLTPREHLIDTKERVAAEQESGSLLNSMYRIIESDKFVASRLNATRIAQEKTYQFWVAAKVGLPMPRTLISNCAERITTFFHACHGGMIYKSLVPMLWETDPNTFRMVRTTCIDDIDVLTASDLASAPGIFQERIDKVAEIRVTILGRSVLALEKRFPHRSARELDVDWRGMHSGAVYSRHDLPAAIRQKSFELLQRLGLVMGCFDFIVDEDGNYHFLEVNPQGQFVWADQVCPELNHVEAMAEFLISKDPNFEYKNSGRVHVSHFSDRQTYERLERHERERHHGSVSSFRYGSVTVPLIELEALPDEAIQQLVQQELERRQKHLEVER